MCVRVVCTSIYFCVYVHVCVQLQRLELEQSKLLGVKQDRALLEQEREIDSER